MNLKVLDKKILNKAAKVAHSFKFYLDNQDNPNLDLRQRGLKAWSRFRHDGIAFVKSYGTEQARLYLSLYLDGANRNEQGPIHFLLGDR